jgi:hypothetical protein
MNPRALVRPVLLALLALAALLLVASLAAGPLVVSRARAVAHARGLELQWTRFDLRWPARAELTGLVVRRVASGDTVLTARAARVALRPLALLTGHARADLVSLDSVRVRLPGAREAEADTLAPTDEKGAPVVAAGVRQRADAIVRALLAPARQLPELRLTGLDVTRGDEPLFAISALNLDHEGDAAHFALTGHWHGEQVVPFDVLLRWQDDDRLTGRAQFDIPDADDPNARPLVLTLDGRVSQDRRAREVRIAPGTVLRIGDAAARLEGVVSAKGPRVALSIALDGLDEKVVQASVPRALLGPVGGLEVLGTWDWHAGVDVDLAKPDSVRFRADVVPHGLALDHALSRPSPAALAGPFTAQIHLPRERVVTREMSAANPHFRTLDHISPYLRDAVVTNEDGGFWKHRGFNTEAIGLAMAANLRSGTYKRGAGTITMQLARNLWLGHRRTLARKAQEVAMAWVMEHLSGLTKERMLEIYLNIIEWGPDVHGADEAARYYFGTDAAKLSLEESLFLTIVVPSPAKWRWRFASDGSLRPFAKAQMHFIANKMASKGWLDPAAVPPADSIRVTLRGPARDLFAAPDTAAAAVAADSSGRAL